MTQTETHTYVVTYADSPSHMMVSEALIRARSEQEAARLFREQYPNAVQRTLFRAIA